MKSESNVLDEIEFSLSPPPIDDDNDMVKFEFDEMQKAETPPPSPTFFQTTLDLKERKSLLPYVFPAGYEMARYLLDQRSKTKTADILVDKNVASLFKQIEGRIIDPSHSREKNKAAHLLPQYNEKEKTQKPYLSNLPERVNAKRMEDHHKNLVVFGCTLIQARDEYKHKHTRQPR